MPVKMIHVSKMPVKMIDEVSKMPVKMIDEVSKMPVKMIDEVSKNCLHFLLSFSPPLSLCCGTFCHLPEHFVTRVTKRVQFDVLLARFVIPARFVTTW